MKTYKCFVYGPKGVTVTVSASSVAAAKKAAVPLAQRLWSAIPETPKVIAQEVK